MRALPKSISPLDRFDAILGDVGGPVVEFNERSANIVG
jgi:hypothetical protein